MILFGKTGNMEILKPLLISFYKIFKQFFKICRSLSEIKKKNIEQYFLKQ